LSDHQDNLHNTPVTITLSPVKSVQGVNTTTTIDVDQATHPGNAAIIAGIGYHTMLRRLPEEDRVEVLRNVLKSMHHKAAYAYASDFFLALKETH